jgi:hypothetical protein
LIVLVFWLYLTRTASGWIVKIFAESGKSTLLFYGLGNIMLNALPKYNTNLPVGFGLSFIFLVFLIFISVFRESIAKLINLMSFGGLRKAGELYRIVAGFFTELVLSLFCRLRLI